MPRAVSLEKIRDFLGLRLEGYNNAEACRLAGFSSRTGNTYLKKFKEDAERNGVLRAARSYGLQVDDLFSLAGDLREKDLKIEECKIGLNIASVLKRLNISPNRFDEFVSAVFIECLNQGVSDHDLGNYLKEFIVVRREHNVNYDEVAYSYQELVDKNEKIEEDLLNIENKIVSAKNRLKDELKAEKTTRDEIKKFSLARDSLQQIGVPVGDYEKLPVLFENLSASEYNPKQVIDLYSSYTQIAKEEKTLEERVLLISSDERRLTNEIRRLERDINEKKSYFDSLRLLEEQHLTPESTRMLTDAISAQGMKHGIIPRESIERLTAEVKEHFYPLLTLGDEEIRKKNRIDALNLQMNALTEEFRIQTEIYESRKKTLDALKSMNEAGIMNRELVTWRSILHTINMDATELKQSIERMGSLDTLVKAKSEEVRDLDNKIEQLNKIHDQLESSLKSLTSDTVQEVKENLNRFNKILFDFEIKFLSEETGFNAETTRILNEVRGKILKLLGSTEESMDKKMKALSTKLENIMEEVKETRDLAYQTGQETGKYHIITIISKLMRGEKIEKNQALSSIYAIANNLESWALSNRENELNTACRGVRIEAMRLLNRV